MKKKTTKKKDVLSVERVLTLSQYDWGVFFYDESQPGRGSFAESMSSIREMAETLYNIGIPLGTKIKITMTPVKK